MPSPGGRGLRPRSGDSRRCPSASTGGAGTWAASPMQTSRGLGRIPATSGGSCAGRQGGETRRGAGKPRAGRPRTLGSRANPDGAPAMLGPPSGSLAPHTADGGPRRSGRWEAELNPLQKPGPGCESAALSAPRGRARRRAATGGCGATGNSRTDRRAGCDAGRAQMAGKLNVRRKRWPGVCNRKTASR